MIFSESLAQWTLWLGNGDFGGTITNLTLSKMNRNTQDRRPGGTPGAIKTMHGWEISDTEITLKGLSDPLFELLNGSLINQHRIFLRAAYTNEFDGVVKSAIVELQGRTIENDFLGSWKGDDDSEGKVTFAPVFYSFEYGGAEKFYYDVANDVVRTNGVDETEPLRTALGRL